MKTKLHVVLSPSAPYKRSVNLRPLSPTSDYDTAKHIKK